MFEGYVLKDIIKKEIKFLDLFIKIIFFKYKSVLYLTGFQVLLWKISEDVIYDFRLNMIFVLKR